MTRDYLVHYFGIIKVRPLSTGAKTPFINIL